jgi:zinc transport system ATP-binding protein
MKILHLQIICIFEYINHMAANVKSSLPPKDGFFVIETKDLTFRYSPGSPTVLENITLSIGTGEYVSILGDNGSGKSTLVRLFLGLLKPTSGTVTRNARRIGYVPQKKDFLSGQFPLTVFEMLDSWRALVGVKDRTAVTECLDRVGMCDSRNALVGTLSGGQAQKVFIARALIGSPDLIVLDEPSTGVDVKSQREMYAFIKELNREQGMTIVSVEHNLDAAVTNSTQIYHLADGNGHLCSPKKYANEFLRIGRRITDV